MHRPPARFQLDVAGYRLLRDGRPTRLERQPMELLMFLAGRPGLLVTREEIAARFWGDGVFVDVERSITRIVAKLRAALHDPADRPRYIETVVGKGYRLIAPLDSPIRAIGVLPFVNRFGDSTDQSVVEGINEELIAELARVSPVAIVARRLVDDVKATARPLCEIARELKVDAILRGAVSGDASHIRATAELIHASFEKQLWAATQQRERVPSAAVEKDLAAALTKELLAALPRTSPRADTRRRLSMAADGDQSARLGENRVANGAAQGPPGPALPVSISGKRTRRRSATQASYARSGG